MKSLGRCVTEGKKEKTIQAGWGNWARKDERKEKIREQANVCDLGRNGTGLAIVETGTENGSRRTRPEKWFAGQNRQVNREFCRNCFLNFDLKKWDSNQKN
jgi:hypothetical protein